MWVSVNERLPSKSSYVLVHIATGLVTSTFYCDLPSFFDYSCGEAYGDTCENSVYFDHARRYGYKVTHWMPLPEPPKQIEGD